MIATLPTNQIDHLLKNSLIGRLGCHADGVTYIIPVSYAYSNDCIYVHAYEGMKLMLMRQKPDVCFEVDDITDTSNWQSVIAWGRFEELHEPAARTNALRLLNNRVLPLQSSSTTHLGATWPFAEDDLSDVDGILFRICLHEKTGRYEQNGQTPRFAF